MKLPMLLPLCYCLFLHDVAAVSTNGINDLVARRLPQHTESFVFSLVNVSTSSNSISAAPIDEYSVSNGQNNTIHISGNSGIALAAGLRWYLTTYCHVDIYWFLEPTLDLAPLPLPRVNATYTGSSIVPWRYHFNTVTFSYTAAFWTWDDWQLQLDWMALRGVNLPLAWVGYEKILTDVFLEQGFTQSELSTFLSGPAFQAWNRFGNIQGSWNGTLPSQWVDDQFSLNKQIVARMVELGMTPVLPCFTGFVPEAIARVAPNASFVNGSAWNNFPTQYTNDTFLEPTDPLFTQLQKSFISKQKAAYGNVSSIYTLDQFNENNPYSGDLGYLRNVSQYTYQSLQAADPNAVWMLQGWLFYSSETFWTNDRVEAFLSGTNNDSMIILDLFSESNPQWQRTNNYYGKPWIWCMLHDYGGNMGLYGQVENVTYNPIEALANKSSTMVGMGLTMEGEEGNEIMYDLVLDQAWSASPIATDSYFKNWTSSRYGPTQPPANIYQAWDILRTTVYNNTDLSAAEAVTKSILVLAPNSTGLLNRTGHHPTAITYDPDTLVEAWKLFYTASNATPSLWSNQAYTYDLADLTRQVLANAFVPLYTAFVSAANTTQPQYNISTASQTGSQMLTLLGDLDSVLAASNNSHFSLSSWLEAAESFAQLAASEAGAALSRNVNATTAQTAAYYAYNAVNQVTLWGPTGQINDYASKQWAGLVGIYYLHRWQLFIDYSLNSTTSATGINAGLKQALANWGLQFDLSTAVPQSSNGTLQSVIAGLVESWPSIFNSTSEV